MKTVTQAYCENVMTGKLMAVGEPVRIEASSIDEVRERLKQQSSVILVDLLFITRQETELAAAQS